MGANGKYSGGFISKLADKKFSCVGSSLVANFEPRSMLSIRSCFALLLVWILQLSERHIAWIFFVKIDIVLSLSSHTFDLRQITFKRRRMIKGSRLCKLHMLKLFKFQVVRS